MDKRDLPIAFIDSGVGGISVLRQSVRLMPCEDFIYFGDSANAPYGTKTEEEIRSLCLSHARRLHKIGIKALVVACNTATSAAIIDLRRLCSDIPVIGIEPALKPAVLRGNHPTVIVMATPLTVKAKKFRDLLGHYADQANIIPLSCPGLMEFVEQGILDGPEVQACLLDLLSPFLVAECFSTESRHCLLSASSTPHTSFSMPESLSSQTSSFARRSFTPQSSSCAAGSLSSQTSSFARRSFTPQPSSFAAESSSQPAQSTSDESSYRRYTHGVWKYPVDAIVLGCTHYPFLKTAISRIAGSNIRVFDGAEGTSMQLRRRLVYEDLLTSRNGHGSIIYTDSLQKKTELCKKLMELPW